jgi:hypothetical protein
MNSKLWKYMEAKEDGSLYQWAGSLDPLPKRPDTTSRPLDVKKQAGTCHVTDTYHEICTHWLMP